MTLFCEIKNRPKISIIVPLYKDELYIDKCLQSLKGQTLRDFEIIMVDDCGEDGTYVKAKQFVDDNACCKKFSCKLLRNPNNMGQAYSRNKGIDEASGKYIAFLDADDYFVNGALEKIFLKMESQNLEELYFNAHSFYESIEAHRAMRENYDKRTSFDKVYSGEEMFSNMVVRRELYPQGALRAYNRDFLNVNNFRFDPNKLHEDLIFWIKTMPYVKRTSFLNEQIYMRRIHVGSISSARKRTLKNVDDHLESLYALNKWVSDNEQRLSHDFKLAVANFNEKYGRLCARDVCYFVSPEELLTYVDSLDSERLDAFDNLIIKPYFKEFEKNPNTSKIEAIKRYAKLPFRGVREVFLYLKERK